MKSAKEMAETTNINLVLVIQMEMNEIEKKIQEASGKGSFLCDVLIKYWENHDILLSYGYKLLRTKPLFEILPITEADKYVKLDNEEKTGNFSLSWFSEKD